MSRTAFLVDGFNLYYSAREAGKATGGHGTKWLDIVSLCESYLHLVSPTAILAEVHYFSALATHRESADHGVTDRHRAWMACLSDTGVRIELARFKRKATKCEHCGRRLTRFEEKETDVAIACRLMEILVSDRADAAVLLTGDTDLAPAARLAKQLFPQKVIAFAFPYGRKNGELAKTADIAFTIGGAQYAKHQLPDPCVLKSGRAIRKPVAW